MSDLTSLTLKAAHERPGRQVVLVGGATQAHVAAVEAARALNAFVLETPEKALEMAKASDARRAAGTAGPLDGAPLGIKDLFCTPRRPLDDAGSKILGEFKPTYESTITANLWRDGAVDAGQAQHGRIRHGLVQRDLGLGPGGQPLAQQGRQRPADARRLVRRLGRPRSAAELCLGATATDKPSARSASGLVHRHRRHQADLRPLLALGRRGLRQLAGPGRADGSARVEDAAILLTSMAGHDPRTPPACRSRRRISRASSASR